MASNTERIIEKMQSSFPQTYNVYDKKTILYALLSVFGSKYGVRTDTIDRLYAMIGIDSTYDEDLEHRWGSLLGIHRQLNESYVDYRNRLKIVYSSLNGGTAEAIKYAIASAAGIESQSEIIDKYIGVYDAWEYNNYIDPSLFDLEEITDESSLYGCIICTVDIAEINNQLEHNKVLEAINNTKASGIRSLLLFIYGTMDESATLSYNDEQSYNDIKHNTTDSGELSGSDDVHANMSYGGTDESTKFKGLSIDKWSNSGTNSAILNVSFITNMYEEPDEYIDVIINANAGTDASGVMGRGILGRMILGNREV